MSRPLASNHLGAGIERHYLTPSPGIVYTQDIEPVLSSSSQDETEDFDIEFTMTIGGGTQSNVIAYFFLPATGFTANATDMEAEFEAANPGWTATCTLFTDWQCELAISTLAVGTHTLYVPIAPNPDGLGEYAVGGPYAINASALSDQASASVSADHDLTITAAAVTCFDIQKTGGTDLIYDSQAYTNESWTGTVEVFWTWDDLLVNVAVGLSADNPDANYTGIDRAILTQGNGQLYKSENGTITALGVGIVAGDTVSVERVMPGGAITYKKNGSSIGSGTASTGTLIVDSSFRGAMDYVSDVKVKIGGVDQALTWVTTNTTVSTCGTIGGGPPPWTIDATSGHAFPADATEHAAFEGNYSTGMGAPDIIWNMQETSGLTVDDASANGWDGTLFATATGYAQTVSGFSRKAMTFADGTNAIQRLSSVPNANAGSCTAIVIAKVNSVGAANQSIVYYGTSQIAHHRLSAAPAKSVMRSGANVSGSGATTVTGSVRPFAMRYDRTNAQSEAYHDVDNVAATHATTPTGVGFTLGGNFPDIEILYVIAWFSSKTEAQLKAWLQAAGWTISW